MGIKQGRVGKRTKLTRDTTAYITSGAPNKGGWENQPFSRFMRLYLENGSIYG